MTNGFDPFDCDADSILTLADSELKNFDQTMSASAVDAEVEAESDSEDVSGQSGLAIPSQTNAIEEVKRRKVGVWKLEYAQALAVSWSWKPCKVIGEPTKNRNSNHIQKCLLGTPLKSVMLEREDADGIDKQFKVNLTGRVFYLLRTPAGVELVLLTQIYYPKDDDAKERSVWIEYYRVMKSSEAIEICDRADTLFQRVQNDDGKTISTSSAGSRQLQFEREERKQQGKSELYHWGDVLCTSNATCLIGGVYWLTRADEKCWLNDQKCRSDVLNSVKDKFTINNLEVMDYVVVGSSFSDSPG